jgi:protein tyrosine phosphatase (PTP) superfamily phosphohydrolase (DUF442 family)
MSAKADQIRNFVQLTNDIATSGQPTEEQFSQIAESGHDVVINLALVDSNGAIPNEGSIVASLGMSYVHVPVPFDHPTPEHLRLFFRVMEVFSGKRIWVHCAMNYRVSAFLYHYLRKVRKLGESEARSPIFDIWTPDNVWREFMRLDPIGMDI